MDANDQSQLEESLRRLSWWTGPEPRLWRKALARSGSSRRAGTGRWSRIARSRWTWFGVPIAAVVALAVCMPSADLTPANPRCAMSTRERTPETAGVELAGQIRQAEYRSSPERIPETAGVELAGLADSALAAAGLGAKTTLRYGFAERPNAETGRGTTATVSGESSVTAVVDRQVIRKGSLDLQAEDVRAVYLKVQMIPSEAESEYVEQSQVSGSGSDVRGYVTLRVRAERVNVVLNSLRSLATVSREQVEASDVTAQVVDLEARLRNEQRVEKELLELLEKRKDSPLADVLKLSESLAAVRERIERLVAQQQQLGRQVALASLLVTINPKDKVVAEAGLGQKLSHSMSSAWADGASFLISTVGGIVRVVIGGAVWWVFLFAGVWVARRRYLRYADREKTAG